MPRLPFRRVLLLLVAALLATPPLALAQTGRVGGIVRTEGGEPIKGATILAASDDIGLSITSTTDDRGRFSILGLRSGQWRFTIEAPGFIGESGYAPVRSGLQNPPITVTLRRAGLGKSLVLGNISAEDLQEQLAEGDVLFEQQQWDAAIAVYENILSNTPGLTSIRLQIASAHRMKGAHDQAIAAYTSLLAAEPQHEKASLGMAMTYLERGDTSQAEKILTETASAPGAGPETFFALAEVRAKQGASTDAASWFLRAATADPSWGKPLHRLAELALTEGDEVSATRYLSQLVAVAPLSAEAELAKATLSRLNR